MKVRASKIRAGFSSFWLTASFTVLAVTVATLYNLQTQETEIGGELYIWMFIILGTLFVIAMNYLGVYRLSRIEKIRAKQLNVVATHTPTYKTTMNLTTLYRRAETKVADPYLVNYVDFEEKGSYADLVAPVYKNEPTKGLGKGMPIHYDLFAVYSVQLMGYAPHVYFDSKKAKGKQAALYFAPEQRYSFAGFNDDEIIAYIPPGQGVDALSDVTPDVLEKIVQASKCDIEMVGDRLQLYAPLWSDAQAQLDYMQAAALAVAGELNSNIIKMQRKQPASEIELRATTRIVSKTRIWPYVLTVVGSSLFTLLTFVSLLDDSNNRDESIIPGLFVLLVSFSFSIFILSATVRTVHDNKDTLSR